MVWNSAHLHRGFLDRDEQYALSMAFGGIETRLEPEHCSGSTDLRHTQGRETPQSRRPRHRSASKNGERDHDAGDIFHQEERERREAVFRICFILAISRADSAAP